MTSNVCKDVFRIIYFVLGLAAFLLVAIELTSMGNVLAFRCVVAGMIAAATIAYALSDLPRIHIAGWAVVSIMSSTYIFL
ncbi:MAG: hypothetical protein AAB791_02570 [Patescibacteria group bacterium]